MEWHRSVVFSTEAHIIPVTETARCGREPSPEFQPVERASAADSIHLESDAERRDLREEDREEASPSLPEDSDRDGQRRGGVGFPTRAPSGYGSRIEGKLYKTKTAEERTIMSGGRGGGEGAPSV